MRYRPILKPAVWFGLTMALFAIMMMPASAQNILDTVGTQYKAASGTWEAILVPIAKALFLKLALIELLWSSIWWVIERDDPNQILVSLLRKIMPLMFFWAILLNFGTWIPAIINGFVEAGKSAGATGDLTPSSVLDRGLEIATKICDAANKMGLFDNISQYILAGLSAICILLAFAVIAGQMLVTLVESYIVVSGGVIFLGFAGSRWTATFSEKYISYAVSVGVKLFVTYLIIGAGQHLSDTWAAMITTDMKVSDYLTILAGSLVYMFLAWQIPGIAASMLTGAVSMTLGSAMATVGTMAAGMAGAAGAAQAAVGGAANGVAGAVKAGNSAMNQAKEKGATNFGGMVAGTTSALAGGMMDSAKDTIKGFGAGSSGGNLANRIDNKTASIRESNAAGAPAASVPGGQPSAPAAPAGPAPEKPPGGGDQTPPKPDTSPNVPTRPTPPAPTGGAAAPTGPAAPGSASTAGAAAAGGAATPAPATAGTGSASATGPAAPGSASADGATAGAGSPQPEAPTSSVIDTSGDVGQALAARDSGASAPPAPAPASTSSAGAAAPAAGAAGSSTPAASAPGAAAGSTSGVPAGTDSSTSSAAGSPAGAPAAPQPPASPPPQNELPKDEKDKQNAMQKFADVAAALGSVPNDAAGGAGVQINLKHD